MGTKKTSTPLEWLQTSQVNKKRDIWALKYLRRENDKAGLLKPGSQPIREQDLHHWISLIQQLHAGLTAPDANPTDHQRAAYLETLDARMRKSWDEKQRRDDPSRKTFTFRMDKQITSKLAALRKRWVMPSASIVESLIQDAVIKNKRQEDVEKAPEEALKRQKRTNLQLVKLRSQRDRAQKEAAQLRKMLRKLIKRLTETEYRRSNKLSLTELLDPSHVIAIKKMTDEAELAYLEEIDDLVKDEINTGETATEPALPFKKFVTGDPMSEAWLKQGSGPNDEEPDPVT